MEHQHSEFWNNLSCWRIVSCCFMCLETLFLYNDNKSFICVFGRVLAGQILPATAFKVGKWSDNNVRELVMVKVLHTTFLNTTMVTFKVLPLGSYAPMPAHSPPFKTILELVLWKDLQSCRFVTPDVINVIKMSSFQYFLYLPEQKKNHWRLDSVFQHRYLFSS